MWDLFPCMPSYLHCVHSLHSADLLAFPGFPLVAENLHDIRPQLTAHPPVCAKEGENVRFLSEAINRVRNIPVGFLFLPLKGAIRPSSSVSPSGPFVGMLVSGLVSSSLLWSPALPPPPFFSLGLTRALGPAAGVS